MTETQFNAMMEKGYHQAKAGEGFSALRGQEGGVGYGSDLWAERPDCGSDGYIV